MLPSLLLTIRTANRAPKRNYLAGTIESLCSQGVDPGQIHVYATDPEVGWMPVLPGVHVHVPVSRLTANLNGLARISLAENMGADWIILSEDDLQWCADPIGSMARWLEAHARSDVMVYRFFAFDHVTPLSQQHVGYAPLREQKGSQVIALRTADAVRFKAWAMAHLRNWRPRSAPFRDRLDDGFDKLVGYWALQDNPSVTYGLVSRPFFVKHMGAESSLHSHGKQIHRTFAGESWSYQEAACHL